MAAGTPCVLSDTTALVDLFTHGTVFCAHEADAIARAVLSAYEHRVALKSQIAEWTVQHQRRIRARVAALRAALRLPHLAPA